MNANWKPWIQRILHLNRDHSKGAAPHKPLLLLVVCDLAEEGRLVGGRLAKDGNLTFRFNSYWKIVAQRRRTQPDVRLPFYHMRSDQLWTPLDRDGEESLARNLAVTARIDDAFMECLEVSEFREELRRVLIEHYFEPDERQALYRLTGVEAVPTLGTTLPEKMELCAEGDIAKRDASFRLRVIPAYDYTCALTGYRMVSTDGKTAVDAAHIMQFKKGGPNIPSNGIALSKTAHWLFDRGFWSVSNDYRVLVKEEEFEETGAAGHLLKKRRDEVIRLPDREELWPAHEYLTWHRRRHGF